MQSRRTFAVCVLAILGAAAGSACNGSAATPAAAAASVATQPPVATTPSPAASGAAATIAATPTSAAGQTFATHRDLLGLFTAEVPADWSHTSFWAYAPYSSSGVNPNHTPDTLESAYLSPDKHGAVLFLQYDDNHRIGAAQLAGSAKAILDTFFAEGGNRMVDVGVGVDSVSVTASDPQPDGSVKLGWRLANNPTTGMTHAYIRGTTVLVLSTLCDDVGCDALAPVLTHVSSTYKVP